MWVADFTLGIRKCGTSFARATNSLNNATNFFLCCHIPSEKRDFYIEKTIASHKQSEKEKIFIHLCDIL
jgi:hypothetical protein